MIEAQSQLGFEPQAGLLDMAHHSDYHLVRLYAMSKDELIKLNQKEAAARFYISDIERNIRMNLFPSYKFALDGKRSLRRMQHTSPASGIVWKVMASLSAKPL